MYENKKQPLLPRQLFIRRVLNNVAIALGVIAGCLSIGIIGYHFTARVPWIDAFHNASMILSGMGPVIEIHTMGGKWFSSFYALFSDIVFIANSGIVLAPGIHRLFHHLHLEK